MNISVANARGLRVVGLLALVLSVVVLVPAAAGAAASSAGRVTFSAASGGSQAEFSVRPPDGAKCPGDTAHDFFLVNSYLVRKGTSPTVVKFSNGVPSRGYGLIDQDAFYGAINTQRNTGELFLFPDHSTWSRLTPKDLFPHGEASTVWSTGLACSDRNGDVQRYWNTEVTFTANAKDPGGFVWSIADNGSSTSSDSNPLLIALIVIAGAAVLVALVARSRRKARETVSSGR